MKNFYVALALLTLMGACNSSNNDKKDDKPVVPVAAAPSISSNPDYQKGLALVVKSDCLTCHKVSEKLIGPAYKDVAAKYDNTEANINLLAAKVLKGGSGVWGAVPMLPHPLLTEPDAKQIVKYILLLRNK